MAAWLLGSSSGGSGRLVVPLNTITAVTAAAMRMTAAMRATMTDGGSRCPTRPRLPG
jgi:hypothetical protein